MAPDTGLSIRLDYGEKPPMYRAAKILLWSTFLFCFTFSSLVWTNPIMHTDSTESASTVPAGAPELLKQQNESARQTRPAPKPAIIFLMGTGLIGLVAIGRNKLFS